MNIVNIAIGLIFHERMITMKKFITLFLSAIMLLSVMAGFSAVAAEKENVLLCTDDEGFAESGMTVAKWQQAGSGNVFYYDYHAAIAAGKDLIAGNDPGEAYKLRLPKYSGSGTASMCDGVKNEGGASHSFDKGSLTMGEKTYDHAFGYCFKQAVTVDEFAFYASAKNSEKPALITGVDVYGGKRGADGTVEYTLLWSSGDTNIQNSKTADGAAYATGKFNAVTIEYVRFAVTTDLAEGSSSYRPYECELFAAEGGAADGDIPNTADTSMALAIALIALISLGGAFLASRKQFN